MCGPTVLQQPNDETTDQPVSEQTEVNTGEPSNTPPQEQTEPQHLNAETDLSQSEETNTFGDSDAGSSTLSPTDDNLPEAEENLRKNTLKEKLVTEYQHDKEAEKEELAQSIREAGANPSHTGGTEGTVQAERQEDEEENQLRESDVREEEEGLQASGNDGHSPSRWGSALSKATDKYLKYSGYLVDASTLFGVGNSAMTMMELGKSNQAADGQQYSDRQQMEMKHKKYKNFNNAALFVSQGLGTMNSGISFLNSRFKKKYAKSERERSFHRAGMFSSALGTLGGLSKMTSTGFTLFGHDSKGSKSASNIFGAIGSAFGAAGAVGSWFGNKKDREYRKKAVSDIDTLRQNNSENFSDEEMDSSRDELDAAKTQLSEDRNEESLAAYEGSKQAYISKKAQKYALQQAAEMQQAASEKHRKGMVSAATSSLMAGIGLLGLIPGIANSTFGKYMKASSSLIGAIGAVGKHIESGVTDLRHKNRMGEARKRVVDQYVTDKEAKIRAEAQNKFPQDSPFRDLEDNEVRRIAAARLGVEMEIENKPLSSEETDAVFQKITHKRAEYIMNADAETKRSSLEAMGLDQNASLENVEAVLRGD